MTLKNLLSGEPPEWDYIDAEFYWLDDSYEYKYTVWSISREKNWKTEMYSPGTESWIDKTNLEADIDNWIYNGEERTDHSNKKIIFDANLQKFIWNEEDTKDKIYNIKYGTYETDVEKNDRESAIQEAVKTEQEDFDEANYELQYTIKEQLPFVTKNLEKLKKQEPILNKEQESLIAEQDGQQKRIDELTQKVTDAQSELDKRTTEFEKLNTAQTSLNEIMERLTIANKAATDEQDPLAKVPLQENVNTIVSEMWAKNNEIDQLNITYPDAESKKNSAQDAFNIISAKMKLLTDAKKQIDIKLNDIKYDLEQLPNKIASQRTIILEIREEIRLETIKVEEARKALEKAKTNFIKKNPQE